MNDPRRLAEVDPAWHAYQYPETGMEEFANAQPSVSTSRRGVKRRKDSSQIEAENARRSQAASGAVAPGHIGSDGFGHGMMIGPGAGVNPEDIHPQVSRVLLDPSHAVELPLSIAYNRFDPVCSSILPHSTTRRCQVTWSGIMPFPNSGSVVYTLYGT